MSDETPAAVPETSALAFAAPLGGKIATQEQLDSLLDDTTGRSTNVLDGLTVFRQGKEDYFNVGDAKQGTVLGIFLLSKRPTRAYWPSDELSDKPPECYSFDGLTPHETSPKIQASKCEDCPWNKPGSGKGKSRKCKMKASDFVLVVPEDYERDQANNLAWPAPKRMMPAVVMYSVSNRGSSRAYQDWIRTLKEKGHRPQGVLTRWKFGDDTSKGGVDYNFVDMEVVMPLPGPKDDAELWTKIVNSVMELKGGNADEILLALTGTVTPEVPKDD